MKRVHAGCTATWLLATLGCGSGDGESDTFKFDSSDSGPTSTATITATDTVGEDGTNDATTRGDGDGDGDGDGEPCFEVNYQFSVQPPNILFVLDKSGSMYDYWYDEGALTLKWTSLHNVVEAVTTSLEDHVNFGAKLYPSLNGSSCQVDTGVEVPLELNNAAAILSTIPGPLDALNGSTPTQVAVEEAYAYLNGVYASDPQQTPPQAVILVADGAVSCSQSAAATEAAIAAAYGQSPNSIRTYVVGISISAFNDDEMNAFAQAGGTALPGAVSFYQTTDGQALEAAMTAIVAAAQSCDVLLYPPPFGEDLIGVTLNGAIVDEVTSCATESGYYFPDAPDLGRIELCGAACDELKLSGDVNVAYMCPGGG